MEKKEEIEFLMRLRKDAQEMVDKITVRIVELQDTTATNKQVGFKIDNGKEKENISHDRK